MTQVAAGRFTRRRSDGHRPLSARHAYSIIEMLITMALIMIVAGLTYASLDFSIPRTKLRSKAVEVSVFLQKARMQAIKNGFDVKVAKETSTEDLDWLVASFVNTAGTVREVGRLYIGRSTSKTEPHLDGVEGGTADAAKALFFGSEDYLSYKPNGTCSGVGGIRLSSGVGNRRNTLEIAVLSLGGQPVMRKYIRPGDRPPSDGASEFFKDTHYGTNWKWVWY